MRFLLLGPSNIKLYILGEQIVPNDQPICTKIISTLYALQFTNFFLLKLNVTYEKLSSERQKKKVSDFCINPFPGFFADSNSTNNPESGPFHQISISTLIFDVWAS